MIWLLLIWPWSWRVSRHCNKLAHEKTARCCRNKNLCVHWLPGTRRDTASGEIIESWTSGSGSWDLWHGRGECQTVSLRRWSYTEVSFPPASSAKPRTWAIMSDFQRSMSDGIDSMYAVCRFFLKHVLLAEVCSGAICTSDKVGGRSWKRRYVGQAETKLKNGLHLYCRPASPSWQSRQ